MNVLWEHVVSLWTWTVLFLKTEWFLQLLPLDGSSKHFSLSAMIVVTIVLFIYYLFLLRNKINYVITTHVKLIIKTFS